MAEYVADDNSEYIAPLTGTYSTDEANKILTLGSDGQGDTTFVLPPTTAWLLVEVYDVNDVYGDIGYQRYTDNVFNIDSYIEQARALAILEYTTFKITATHYYGNNTCDVYRGDESTPTTLFNESLLYTPSTVSWKLRTYLTTPINILLDCNELYDCNVEWLCDTVAERYSEEKVIGGTFDTSLSDWVGGALTATWDSATQISDNSRLFYFGVQEQ